MVQTDASEKLLGIEATSVGRDVAAVINHDKPRVCSVSSKITEARKRAAKSITNKARLGVRATPPKRDKGKKVRIYDGYIKKKFSPSIMTDVLLNQSEAQSEWVKKAVYEHLLGLCMLTYPHKLGYKIVDAFCSRTCELRLKVGAVVILESLVHKIIGLPQGELDIELKQGKVEGLDGKNNILVPRFHRA